MSTNKDQKLVPLDKELPICATCKHRDKDYPDLSRCHHEKHKVILTAEGKHPISGLIMYRDPTDGRLETYSVRHPSCSEANENADCTVWEKYIPTWWTKNGELTIGIAFAIGALIVIGLTISCGK